MSLLLWEIGEMVAIVLVSALIGHVCGRLAAQWLRRKVNQELVKRGNEPLDWTC